MTSLSKIVAEQVEQILAQIERIETNYTDLHSSHERWKDIALRNGERALNLQEEVDALKAARQAYANEFEGDVGSIHQNIRALKAERDQLEASRG